jgi:hypothetical protein
MRSRWRERRERHNCVRHLIMYVLLSDTRMCRTHRELSSSNIPAYMSDTKKSLCPTSDNVLASELPPHVSDTS